MRRFCLSFFAIAHLLMSKSKKMPESIRMCVSFIEVRFVEYVLYLFCLACMIFAHGAAVQFAIALLLMSRKNKNKKHNTWKDMCVCNDVCFLD